MSFEWNSFIGLGGVALGWFLNNRSSTRQRNLDVRLRAYDTKVDAYVVWLRHVRTDFYRYIHQSAEAYKPDPDEAQRLNERAIAYQKLILIEDDAELRTMIEDLPSVYPEPGSQLEYDLYCESNAGPSFSYDPFDKRIDAIVERVRASRPKS